LAPQWLLLHWVHDKLRELLKRDHMEALEASASKDHR
jgi:hypothetical protein